MENNIIVLQNNEKWKEIMELDLSNLSNKLLERKDNKLQIRGHYIKIHNDLIMFYRKNELLYFNINNTEICLENVNLNLSFSREGRNNIFSIYNKDEIIYSISYQSYRFDRLNMLDPDFNEDQEENQDFFLFIHNVIKNPAWRKRIYTSEFD
jgi:hypothetical protein